MKTILMAAAAALAFCSAAAAETLEFPADKPIASVTFPDDWTSEETTSGVQTFAPEDAIRIYADIAPMEAPETVAGDAIQFLVDNGVTIDPASIATQEGTFNGMTASVISYAGTDASGPVDIVVNIVALSESDLLIFSFWGKDGANDQYADELAAITASLKPIAN